MEIQRWWGEFQHQLWYHVAKDEAYLRHHYRDEVECNLRDVIRHQRAQMALQTQIGRAQIEVTPEQTRLIERGFAELGRQVEDLTGTFQGQ